MEQENNTNVLINEEVNLVKQKTQNIKNLIYTVRGKQVMIDSDEAKLYHCETKYINRVVKRNIKRFPEEFCFQLTENEFQNYGANLSPQVLKNKTMVEEDIYHMYSQNKE